MNKDVISTPNAPAAVGPYSQGIRVGDIFFLSGQIPLDPATGKLEFPPEMQHIPGMSTDDLAAMFFAVGKPYIEGAYMTKHNGTYYL